MEDISESVDYINTMDWTDAKGMAKESFYDVREEMHRLSQLGANWNINAIRFYYYNINHDYNEPLPF